MLSYARGANFVLFLAVTLAACAAISSAHEAPPLVVFLVRHAEKVDSSRDPELSAAGRNRAAWLAQTLRDARIGKIHSSDYARTRQTAAPIAADRGLKLNLYDPRDLGSLIERLMSSGGRHLVVGHSNTTPEMVERLGGDPGPAIDERWEYDRLYVVTIAESGAISTTLLRYGPRLGPRQKP